MLWGKNIVFGDEFIYRQYCKICGRYNGNWILNPESIKNNV